jgi:hypothetical protein
VCVWCEGKKEHGAKTSPLTHILKKSKIEIESVCIAPTVGVVRIGTVDAEVHAFSISHRLRRTTYDHLSWHTCTNATIFPSPNAKVIALFSFLFQFIFTNATIFPSPNAKAVARMLLLHTCSPFTLLLLDIARSLRPMLECT